jgi:hypothetical protein
MTGEDRNRVQINHLHAGAICTEIGQRLQTILKEGPAPMPSRLQRLTDQLESVECRDEPSIEID